MARPDKNKQYRREALREELQAREYLRQIDQVNTDVSENWQILSSEQISALRLKSDINFKRLAKVLPDLKAVEISGDGGGPVEIGIVDFSSLYEPDSTSS